MTRKIFSILQKFGLAYRRGCRCCWNSFITTDKEQKACNACVAKAMEEMYGE